MKTPIYAAPTGKGLITTQSHFRKMQVILLLEKQIYTPRTLVDLYLQVGANPGSYPACYQQPWWPMIIVRLY